MTNPDPLRSRLAVALGDRYALERELTGGGMARVFVAHEAALNRRVVIKTLAPDLAATLSAERFDREIQLVAALQHPNIVGVLTSGAADGVPWFAMPFVEGDSLRARLAGGPVGESEAVGILRDVARALAYAHDRGVVHRDIKPDNILLSGDAAVVTDFGIAKAVTAARTQAEATPATGAAITSAGISLGTPAYMAPEQAAADTNVDRRADLYALGCVAYELVTGHPPFTGGSAAELLRAHLLTPPPAIPTAAGVSRGYAALVARCLAKDPAQRPASARDVLRALEQLGGVGEPAGAPSGLAPALVAWAATLGATYVLARAAVVGVGLPDFTVAWATGAAALGLPVVLATWWVKRTARQAQLATPTWTPGGTLTQTTLAGLAIKASPYATWRRARRLPWIAVGAVAAAVAVLLGLRAASVGPWRPVAQPGALLLADFTTGARDTTLVGVVGQLVRTALQESATLQLVPPDAVALVLQRMARNPATPLTAPLAREVAQRAGIPLVITGHLSEAGNGLMIAMRLESAETGAPLATVQEGADGAERLQDAVDRATRRLRERAGDSYRDVSASPPLAAVTTPSIAALRAYTRSLDLADRHGDLFGALPAIEEAIRLDSTFASAWWVSASHRWSLRQPPSLVLRDLRAAYRWRERATRGEQEAIKSLLVRLTNTRQRYEAFRQRDTANPRRDAPYALLRDLGQDALAESLAVVRLRADSLGRVPSPYFTYINLAAAQAGLGKIDAARQTLSSVERLAPGSISAQMAARHIAWRTGGVDSLEAYLRRLQASPNPRLAAGGTVMQAFTMGLRGRLTAFGDAARRAQAAPPNLMQAMYALQPAMSAIVTTAVQRDRPARGVAQLDSLRRRHPQQDIPPVDRWDPQLAAAYAQLGRPDLARPLLAAHLRALAPDERLYTWGAWRLAEGEIALAEGRVPDAIRAFRSAAGADSGQAEAAWTGRTSAALARAFDRGGQADSAAVYFAKVADGLLPADAPLVLPIALRRLGELAEARGDLAEALRRYRAFAQLWRNADAELQPQVANVRRRISELEAREARAR